MASNVPFESSMATFLSSREKLFGRNPHPELFDCHPLPPPSNSFETNSSVPLSELKVNDCREFLTAGGSFEATAAVLHQYAGYSPAIAAVAGTVTGPPSTSTTTVTHHPSTSIPTTSSATAPVVPLSATIAKNNSLNGCGTNVGRYVPPVKPKRTPFIVAQHQQPPPPPS